MPKMLYALRHAETLFNRQNKTQGWCDSPLTKRGIEQARIAGQEIAKRGLTFDHAHCSTAERCSDTLEIATAEAFGAPMPYERHKDLREFNFGPFEAKDNFLEPGFPRGDFYVSYGGENDEMVQERMMRALTEIMERPDHQNVLMVGSGGSLRVFYVANQERAEARPTFFCNCMAYRYEYENGLFTCKEFIVPDLSPLEEPGLPTQMRALGTDASNPWANYYRSYH
ncbi:MAG: histidine phosphatase family protein [Coriobacteriales bacterium]|nr:histidine phosphatase family protein [Coriobacteriales bacterium]